MEANDADEEDLVMSKINLMLSQTEDVVLAHGSEWSVTKLRSMCQKLCIKPAQKPKKELYLAIKDQMNANEDLTKIEEQRLNNSNPQPSEDALLAKEGASSSFGSETFDEPKRKPRNPNKKPSEAFSAMKAWEEKNRASE